MNYKYLKVGCENSVCFITLQRPEVFNALNGGLLKELAIAVKQASADTEIRAVVLTGSGDKAFCSGADLKEGAISVEKPLGDTLKENYEPVIFALRECPKPVICKMNGVAAGAGMSLALACDLIIADEDAYMSELFVGIGLMPDAGSMFFLPRMIGTQKAFDICSTGRKVYMPEALELGLVSKSVPKLQLDEAVDGLLNYYRNAATFAIGEMKKVLNQSLYSNLKEVLSLEAEAQTACGESEDFVEGVTAFVEKRKPAFKGK